MGRWYGCGVEGQKDKERERGEYRDGNGRDEKNEERKGK